MSNLTGQSEMALDSKEVAEMVGKRHGDLLRDIRNYRNYLDQSNIATVDFFESSAYVDGKGERRICYKISKKGCEFIANKLTGQKGTQFTATYINRFHEMQDKLQKPQSIEDLIIMQAQSMKDMRAKVDQVESQVTAVKQSMAEVKDDWRKYVNRIFAALGKKTGDYEGFRKESYILLDRRAHSDIEKRLDNKITRMMKAGASKTAIGKANKLDIIEDDPKLKEIYVKIVQEIEAKHL